MLITDVVQSSSATTVMVLALATGGLLGDPQQPAEVLPRALPLILGCNIGTCITALLASIGTNIVAKRVAVAHVTFNIIGATWVMLVLPLFVRVVLCTSDDLGQLVANSHIMFNVANALVFLPLTSYYARLLVELVPGVEPKRRMLQHLDNRLLNAPSLAISASERELVNMAEISRDMMQKAMKGLFEKDRALLDIVANEENSVDGMQKAITEYLVLVAERDLSLEQSEKLPALLHIVNDIERIGDHAENLVELAQAKLDDRMKFSKKAFAETRQMYQLVDTMFGQTIAALRDNDPQKAALVLETEEKVNRLDKDLRSNHIDRLKAKKCKVPAGVIFLDLLTNFEKIADHLTNIAEAVSDALQWNGVQKTAASETPQEPKRPSTPKGIEETRPASE
jgi:phosphate:Na+ symporter